MVSHLMVPRPKIRCMNDLSNVRSRIRYRRISSSLVDNIPASTINFSSVQMYFVKLKGKPKNKLLFLSVQIVAIHRSSFSLHAFPVYRIKLFILLYILLLKMKNVCIISGIGVCIGHPSLHIGFLQFKHLFASLITCIAISYFLSAIYLVYCLISVFYVLQRRSAFHLPLPAVQQSELQVCHPSSVPDH